MCYRYVYLITRLCCHGGESLQFVERQRKCGVIKGLHAKMHAGTYIWYTYAHMPFRCHYIVLKLQLGSVNAPPFVLLRPP